MALSSWLLATFEDLLQSGFVSRCDLLTGQAEDLRISFLIADCQNELERGDNAGAMDDLEARIVATLLNMGREVQSLFTLVHKQVALTNCLLQYVSTCVVEPPEDVLPAARAN
jgi:hypothetical protein